MDVKKIKQVVKRHRRDLYSFGAKSKRMNLELNFTQVPRPDLVNHCLYLAEGILEKLHTEKHDQDLLGKINRHLGFIQGMLFASELYTIKELMELNKPEEESSEPLKH